MNQNPRTREPENPRTTELTILGLGNVLMGDDGFGPYLVRTIDALFELPPEVTVIDVGTPGLDLTPYVADADVVIFVDTVSSSDPPGTLHVYSRDDLLRHRPAPRVSPHDPGLKEAILTLQFAGRAPRFVTLVGVVPERVAPGPGLSDIVRRTVPAAIATVMREVLRHRVSFTRRRVAREAAIWWETKPARGPSPQADA